ncbi:MAG: 1-acyl-sn-glycerol-3-phosphate acyltransferase [Alistipes sp.]|nr:1-acyl-sn-glycerol-3-phosphate acyltransferase [Alistipes sp.]MBQ3234184.1 1-acyl-sn-glycerol-3-phosphate acyltransferase [Alistipes sp.]MBR3590051.1 1-acyl-sn-glycerol-3-phosphate acyltransferase [Alistipes sp.]MBR3892317.1 1-acyl-sn-glycerol-3-phosphate acyltransferase [Alistipes sp.]
MLSLLYYLVVIAVALVLYVASFIALVVCYPFDRKRVVVHTLSKWITDTIFGLPPFMKREVIGIENIDPKKAYVMTLNHNSMADIITIYNLPLVFKWVSKKEVYRIPIVGRLLYAHGDIVINRASAKEAMQLVHERGKEWLAKGASVAIFPEGTRSKDGEIHNFKAGAFLLAKDAGAPILPIVLNNTNKMMRKGWLMNWRNHITIKILPPISAEEVAERSVKEVMADVHSSMTEALAEIRKR